MNKRIILLVFILFTCLLLSSCSDGESEWIEIFIQGWFDTAKGSMVTGKEVDLGKIVDLTIDRALGEVAPTPLDDAIDGAQDTIKDIEKADDLLDEGLSQLDVSKLEEAQELRPDDYTYHEAEAIVWLIEGNNAAAQAETSSSDGLLIQQIENGGNCRTGRLNQLRTRRDLLARQIKDEEVSTNIALRRNIDAQIANIDLEIEGLLNDEPSAFCALYGK